MLIPGADVPIVVGPGGVVRVPQPTRQITEAMPMDAIKHRRRCSLQGFMVTSAVSSIALRSNIMGHPEAYATNSAFANTFRFLSCVPASRDVRIRWWTIQRAAGAARGLLFLGHNHPEHDVHEDARKRD